MYNIFKLYYLPFSAAQTGSGAHPTSYQMGNGVKAAGA
jgi:hypothetical protein